MTLAQLPSRYACPRCKPDQIFNSRGSLSNHEKVPHFKCNSGSCDWVGSLQKWYEHSAKLGGDHERGVTRVDFHQTATTVSGILKLYKVHPQVALHVQEISIDACDISKASEERMQHFHPRREYQPRLYKRTAERDNLPTPETIFNDIAAQIFGPQRAEVRGQPLFYMRS